MAQWRKTDDMNVDDTYQVDMTEVETEMSDS